MHQWEGKVGIYTKWPHPLHSWLLFCLNYSLFTPGTTGRQCHIVARVACRHDGRWLEVMNATLTHRAATSSSNFLVPVTRHVSDWSNSSLATRHFAPSHLDDCILKDTEQQLPLVSSRCAVSFSTLWDGDDAQARTAWTGWKTDELISVNLKLHLLMQFNAWVLPCWFVGAWIQVMEVCMTPFLSWHCQQPCTEHNPLVFSLSYPLSVLLLILNMLSLFLLLSLFLPFNSLFSIPVIFKCIIRSRRVQLRMFTQLRLINKWKKKKNCKYHTNGSQPATLSVAVSVSQQIRCPAMSVMRVAWPWLAIKTGLSSTISLCVRVRVCVCVFVIQPGSQLSAGESEARDQILNQHFASNVVG